MPVHRVEGARQQLAGFGVDLPNRVFQCGHRLDQVGRLRVEELLAFAGAGQLVQCGEVHRTECGHLAVQAVDLALQTAQLHLAGADGLGQGLQVGAGVGQHLRVLLKAKAGGLLFQLEFGDAAAQWLQLALQRQAAFVAGAQLGGQVVVLAAAGAQRLLALQLQSECGLQTALGGSVGQAGQLVVGLFVLRPGSRRPAG